MCRERIREHWEKKSSIKTKWNVLKTALCKGAKELGVEDR